MPHCTHSTFEQRGPISLPVLADHHPQGQIRKSRNGKKRAIVLALVQLILIAHIALWLLSKKFGWFGGETITPVEPSESMEFVKNGVVNAGLIFFAVALLSTLILGRWFCGWGCHIVMLQDFCGWLMKKCGVRPKPFRSRLLVFVPFILAFYMFIMPAVHRWALVPWEQKLAAARGEDHWLVQTLRTSSTAIGFPLPYGNIPPWQVTAHLTTPDFWKTFASYGVAIPFLFVCGFAVVYFLGAKGFCTYGCPYGGFFAPLDRFAAGRIIVTDACEHCGHCTAVCTSNVRVHEEVREYGMVVDPGCMKCMDCVSVCPNDALYFGFAKPSILKGAARNERPTRKYDLSLGEEFAAAGVFLLSFLAVRGVYGLVPMLMAAGIAGIVTFLTWKLWRLARDQNVVLHRFQLKLKGKLQRAGWVFIAGAVLALATTLHCGAVNASLALAHSFDDRVTIPQSYVFGSNPMKLDDTMAAAAGRALKWYGIASSIRDGGIGLLRAGQSEIDIRRVWLHSARQEYDAAIDLARRVLARDGVNDLFAHSLLLAQYTAGRPQEALDEVEPMLLQVPEMAATLNTFGEIASETDQDARMDSLCEQRLKKFPDHLYTMRVLSMRKLQHGEVEEGVKLIRRTIEIDPSNASAFYYLSIGLAEMGRMSEAIDAMSQAAKLDPRSIPINSMLADMLDAADRHVEADVYRAEVFKLQEEHKKHMSSGG